MAQRIELSIAERLRLDGENELGEKVGKIGQDRVTCLIFDEPISPQKGGVLVG